jgi:hypothetical protein
MSGLVSNNRSCAGRTQFAIDSVGQCQATDRIPTSNVDLNGAAWAQLVIPVRIEASQLTWMLGRGAVAASGYVIVMVDANANMPPPSVLPYTGSGSRLHGNPSEPHSALDPEPIG